MSLVILNMKIRNPLDDIFEHDAGQAGMVGT